MYFGGYVYFHKSTDGLKGISPFRAGLSVCPSGIYSSGAYRRVCQPD
jgi:hypothetical protein